MPFTKRLDYLEKWIRRLSEERESEWRDAGRARDHIYRELDAWIAEVQLLQAGQHNHEIRLTRLEGTMTDERAQLLGNSLTSATDALVRLCWPENERAPAIVSDFLAELLGRATTLASGAVVGVHTIAADANNVLEARIVALEADVAVLKERVVGGDDR